MRIMHAVSNGYNTLILGLLILLTFYKLVSRLRGPNSYNGDNNSDIPTDNIGTSGQLMKTRTGVESKATNEMDNKNDVCEPISSVISVNVTANPFIRETTCNCCFKHNYDYLINNKHICQTSGRYQEVDLFIMIFTKHDNVLQRQAIRDTWLTVAKENTANVRYVFLLGSVDNETLTIDVAEENIFHRDIIIEDFVDTYENQTLKTIMGFKWIVNNCPKARNVLKTDDDTFINVPNILKYIRNSGNELKKYMIGSCKNLVGPIRDNSSKWYTSEHDYKEELYPWHCSGSGYLTSFTMVQKIYKISPYIPFFWIEDIYVALCLRKVGGSVKHVGGFHRLIPKFKLCLFKGDNLYTAHEVSPETLRNISEEQACQTERVV